MVKKLVQLAYAKVEEAEQLVDLPTDMKLATKFLSDSITAGKQTIQRLTEDCKLATYAKEYLKQAFSLAWQRIHTLYERLEADLEASAELAGTIEQLLCLAAHSQRLHVTHVTAPPSAIFE